MRFSTAISTNPDLGVAIQEVCERAFPVMPLRQADLVILFVSPSTRGDPRRIAETVKRFGKVGRLIGCSGSGVIGAGEEVEGQPAVSLLLAQLPEVEVVAQYVRDADLPDADAAPSEWTKLIGMPARDCAGLMVLLEPFTASPDPLLSGLDFAYPSVPKIGGIASGSQRPGVHILLLDDRCEGEGSLVAAFRGNVSIEAVVAQGCKPFGVPGTITEARGQELLQISGRSTVEFLQQQLENLNPVDLDLAHHNPLFLGIGHNPLAVTDPAPGDYLVRNVIGFDPKSGALRIGDQLTVGRRVRFHLRDRHKSHDDLVEMLERSRQRGLPTPAGAVLFSCVGRGRNLYGSAGHDSRVFAETIGAVPLAGFFCNGEIGPVHESTYLHGFTSSFGLFRPKL